MKFLRSSIGFDGWRFDFVKGYPGDILKEYIDSTVPELSVGEFWDTCEYTNSVLNYNQVYLTSGTVEMCVCSKTIVNAPSIGSTPQAAPRLRSISQPKAFCKKLLVVRNIGAVFLFSPSLKSLSTGVCEIQKDVLQAWLACGPLELFSLLTTMTLGPVFSTGPFRHATCKKAMRTF